MSSFFALIPQCLDNIVQQNFCKVYGQSEQRIIDGVDF